MPPAPGARHRRARQRRRLRAPRPLPPCARTCDPRTFVKPYDFIDDDRHPDDDFGHGTHVAGTLASATNNRRGVAGIAYGAKLMPLRVLDSQGYGDSAAIARAIRYATRHHADVINLSLEFDMDVRAAEIPDVIRAIRYAHARGVVVVAAAGNTYDPIQVAYPARSSVVIAVGATTYNGCQADYSNQGRGLDVMAPGGGADQSLRGPHRRRALQPHRQQVDHPADLRRPRRAALRSAAHTTKARRWRRRTCPRSRR